MHDEQMPRLVQNEARWDRALRVALGLGLFAIGLSGFVAEPLGGALRIASIVPFATAALGWCPLYEALGRSTRRDSTAGHEGESISTPIVSEARA